METGSGQAGRAPGRVDGEPVITTNRGLVVVDVASRVSAACAALPERGMRVPVQMRWRPLFEVGAEIPPESCVAVGHGEWAQIGRATGTALVAHVDNRNPGTAELDVYLASGEPLPFALGETLGAGTLAISVEQSSQQQPQRERLAARARLCSISPEPLRFSAETGRTEVYLGPGGDVCFGRGWGRTLPLVFGFERDVPAGDAELLLPLEAPAAVDVAIRLGGTADGGTAELIVNGSSMGARPYPAGWNTVTWASPGAAWRTGVNRVVLRVQGASLARVRHIELVRADAGSWT